MCISNGVVVIEKEMNIERSVLRGSGPNPWGTFSCLLNDSLIYNNISIFYTDECVSIFLYKVHV